MPLRDHFRPPVDDQHSWEELHGGWPMVIVQQLRNQLPAGYIAGPRIHSGSQIEVDIATYERDDSPTGFSDSDDAGGEADGVTSGGDTVFPPGPANTGSTIAHKLNAPKNLENPLMPAPWRHVSINAS